MHWVNIVRALTPPIFLKMLRSRYACLPLEYSEFLAWMGFINPGMLQRGNMELFSYCVERLPSNAPLVEIGSFAGLSLNHLIYFVRRAGRTNPIFSVDEWKFEGAQPGQLIKGSKISFDAYRDHVIETFRRNVLLFSSDRLPHHIELSSDQFFAAWHKRETRQDYFGNTAALGGPISFAYIDGDHSYQQSKRDFENVDRYLEVGGFIVFDDSADYSGCGSERTAQEASTWKSYELVAKNPNYCLRKRGTW
jgi:Methyltransferase domain